MLVPYFRISNNEILFDEHLSARCYTKLFEYIFSADFHSTTLSGQEETEASRAYEFPKDIILEGNRTGRPGFTFYAVLPNHLMRVLVFIIFWSFLKFLKFFNLFKKFYSLCHFLRKFLSLKTETLFMAVDRRHFWFKLLFIQFPA